MMENKHIVRFQAINKNLIRETNFDDIESLINLIYELENYINNENNNVDEKDMIRKVLANLKRKIIELTKPKYHGKRESDAIIDNTVKKLKLGQVPNLFLPGYKINKMESLQYNSIILKYDKKSK